MIQTMTGSQDPLNDPVLLAFLDESLPESRMAEIETRLRNDEALRERLQKLSQQHDQGVHSLGEIWRRHRLSCPTRSELGAMLLEALSAEQVEFIRMHLEETGCRYCQANLEDLKRKAREAESDQQTRRQRIFQSSIGYLKD
ncbi:MAG: hypothetical protein ACKN81_19865 [Pirellulaceae bacterium]|jgi:hypothetical protein